jgi:hypothetical protein
MAKLIYLSEIKMYGYHARRMLEHILEVLDESDPEWGVMRRLRDIPEYDNLIRRMAARLEYEFDQMYVPLHWRYKEEHERLLSRQNAQLDRLEQLLSRDSFGCRFAEGKEGGPWFTELITISANRAEGSVDTPDADIQKVSGDPHVFKEHLKKTVKKSQALVIVDPYALAAKDDAGSSVSARSTIREIVFAARDIDPVHLHLYCRMDAVEVEEWEGLKQDLKDNRLSVYLGDFHDRYIFSGRMTHSNAACDIDNWHGSQFWVGSTFGASLNGIGKRPTYILDFKAADTKQLISYISAVAPRSTSLETVKAAKGTKAKAKSS